MKLKTKDLLTLNELDKKEIGAIIDNAIKLKRELKAGICKPLLKNKTLAMTWSFTPCIDVSDPHSPLTTHNSLFPHQHHSYLSIGYLFRQVFFKCFKTGGTEQTGSFLNGLLLVAGYHIA